MFITSSGYAKRTNYIIHIFICFYTHSNQIRPEIRNTEVCETVHTILYTEMPDNGQDCQKSSPP